MSCSDCCFLTCIQVSQEAGKAVWYSYIFKNFPQFIVIHTVKGFGIANKAKVNIFLQLSCLFDDPMDVGNLISVSSDFSKTSLNIWKFMIHVFLKSGVGGGMRHSTHGKGHEEGGSTYAKAESSLRSPPGNSWASTPITRACLFYYFVLSPTPLTLRGAVPHHLFWRRS